MMELKKTEGSREWWEQTYAAKNDFIYGKAPSNFLANYVTALKKGPTLDVGMGEGRNAVFLAQKGFEVTGIDYSETATRRAATLAQETGVKIDIKTQDISFFVIPLMKYASIILCNFKAPLTQLKSLARGLEPGGTLIAEAYLTDELKSGAPHKPEFFECYKSNELLEYVKELQVLYYSELPNEKGELKAHLIAKKNMKMG